MTIKEQLVEILGNDGVSEDRALRELFSEDIWSRGTHVAAFVARPTNLDQLAAVAKLASEAGVPLSLRGAGMSYTGSYLPASNTGIALDMSAMNRIIRISPEDMTVTVEPGCTWTALNDALKPLGLRTPFWGPMSGIYSTIGGGLSQLNAMFGAGHYGTSSESVIALTMVLGDGRVLRTGARGPDGNTPFYRNFGPDLAGLFMGDCGVFGIKAEITMRLIRRPQHEDHASFQFGSGEDMLNAMAEMARAGIACEMCAFDPGLTKVRMARAGLVSDVKTLGSVISAQKTLGKGLMAAAKIALGGRKFIEEDSYPLHVIAEGRSEAGVAHDMAEARAIAARFNGEEIENTIAKVIRSMPFPAPNSMLGPQGENWAPVHGHVSLSNAPKMFSDIIAMFNERAADFERVGVQTGFLFTSLSTNAITLEPVFYWPTGYRPVHASMVEPAHLAKLKKFDENQEATAVVASARKAVIEIARKYGAAHFQIGRSYPYLESRDAASAELLHALKSALDPKSVVNRGVLGLTSDDPA